MRLRVEYVWLEGSSWFVPVFLILWSVVVAFVGYTGYLAHDAVTSVLCLVVIALAVYCGIAVTINKTIILVSPERIEICHAPMPWFGERELSVSEIQSIGWKERANAEGARFSKFYFNMVDGRKIRIFAGVSIGKPDAALRAVEKVTGWLSPFRKLDVNKI
jgi:hypothetical protein